MTTETLINPEELISVQAAANELGWHRATVYLWLEQGKIKGIKISGAQFIYRSEVERVRKEDRHKV